jgi:cyclase
MLKKRLIACLVWSKGMIVQSIGFKHTNVVGNAITAVDFFNTWAVDEIVILNASRQADYSREFLQVIEGLSERCFVPLTAGGWVRNCGDIRKLLANGADKIILNTRGYRTPGFITEASKKFGRQCIVVSIDVKLNEQGIHEVYIDRGQEPTGMDAVTWAKKAEILGAGEIFLTSIDRDGARNGYDCGLLKQVSESVDIPVIASGGVGEWKHMVEGITTGRADAVSAANIFHFHEQSTKIAKDCLIEAGLEVRSPVFYKISVPRRPVYNIYR